MRHQSTLPFENNTPVLISFIKRINASLALITTGKNTIITQNFAGKARDINQCHSVCASVLGVERP